MCESIRVCNHPFPGVQINKVCELFVSVLLVTTIFTIVIDYSDPNVCKECQ